MSNIASINNRVVSPSKNTTRKSPPRTPSTQKNTKSPPKSPKSTQTSNSVNKTLKVSNPRHPAINITKSQFERFRQQFENLFTYMDEKQKYEVSEEMIKPYLTNYMNNLNEKPEVYSSAMKLFKSHRYLLYLDQFIEFVNKFTLQPGFLSSFTSSSYFYLPIAARVIPRFAAANNNRNLAAQYSAEIYQELQPINDRYQKVSRNMKDISLINCHGMLTFHTTFQIVPNDVIIAFPTPLNKFQSSSFTNKKIFKILEQHRYDPDFLSNPACYLRDDNCMQYTIYYYPGQLIPNFEFSLDTSIDWESKELGFFPSNPDKNMRDELFNKEFDTKYSTNMYYLFKNKQELLKNKITYINCCRKCDSNIPNISTEFLYRYEHIITYMNISNCLSIETEINYNMCSDITFRKKLNIQYNKLAENNSGHTYFYDPTLLSTFKHGDINKSNYLNKDAQKYNESLIELNKITTDELQLEKFDEILRSFIQKLHENNELFSDRIVDLIIKTNIKFDLIYLLDHKVIDIIYSYFTKYNQSEKIPTIFDIIFNKLHAHYSVIAIYKYLEQLDNYIYIIKLFLDKLKQLELLFIIDDCIESLLTEIKYNNISTELSKVSTTVAGNIITKKIQILELFNSDPEISKIINKRPTDNTKTFINLVFLYYSKKFIEGDIIISLFDIYSDTQDGQRIYMFSPDSDLNIDIDTKSIDEKIRQTVIQEQSPLLYSICLATNLDTYYEPTLVVKLLDTSIRQYQNNNMFRFVFETFKNTYLHCFIYLLCYVNYISEFEEVIINCIANLIDITHLYPSCINLYVYLKKLIAKYTLPTANNKSIFNLGSNKIRALNIREPILTKKKTLRTSTLDILIKFNNKFENDYVLAYPDKTTRPQITYLEPGNLIFDTLFM